MAETTKITKRLPKRTALRQTTLTETIYAAILERLRRGEVGRDDRILDYEIAEAFECTRTPVRQALLRLVSEGYLTGTTRGFVMPTLTNEDVHEIFEVRRLLEPSAAASAAAMLDAGVEDALARAYRKARKACDKGNGKTMIEADSEFRDAWLGAVQNVRLQDTIRRFADHAHQIRLGTLNDAAAQKVLVDVMRGVLDGFAERSPKRINDAMLTFINRAEEQYFALLGGRDSAGSPP
ncbi:GntR family transcriptional regulator [Burkholderia sp. IMCC1007]|uniref:GntR family transcriptional regulator n=1 Tax=Burkholderia sp. IMCC1007 TaxID=3004104 RepID=UPI0022B47230|nr:GntR family transcriptional regulator [Burkholderia sp. IMCC1007]